MSNKAKPVSATEAMSERAMTSLFARAFSQPLKLLGQTEASLSSYAVFWCVASNDGSTQVEVANLTGLSAKTVSRVISQLGETRDGRGWIRQQFDDADRRVEDKESCIPFPRHEVSCFQNYRQDEKSHYSHIPPRT